MPCMELEELEGLEAYKSDNEQKSYNEGGLG